MILGNKVPLGVFHILAGLLNDSGHRQDVILGEDVVLWGHLQISVSDVM